MAWDDTKINEILFPADWNDMVTDQKTRLGPVFDVTNYGAVSGADSTTAFNNAMTAAAAVGGIVFVPRGIYTITSALRNWPTGTFSTMQGGMKMIGEGTHSELRYTGATGYCLEIYDQTGASSPVGVTVEDLHISAPNVADPDDGGCIGVGGSIITLNRITIDDANTATGVFVGLGAGQSIVVTMNNCGFYGSSRIGRAVWMDGTSPMLYINDSFFGCKDGILTDNDAYIKCNNVYIYATGCPIYMDDSNLYMEGGWVEGGDTDCYLGGPRSFYKIDGTVIGATNFIWESGAEVYFSPANQRDLTNTPLDASIPPGPFRYKIFPAVHQNVWSDMAGVNRVVDADALNGYALQIDTQNAFTGVAIRPSDATEYYDTLPRGTYRLTLFMKDTNQVVDDCAVYTSEYNGAWSDILHDRITLTSSYNSYTFIFKVDQTLVASHRWHGIRWRVWKLAAGANTISISDARLEYLGPDRPGRGDVIAYNSEASDANNARTSALEFKGIQSGKESHTLARITAAHDGAADDMKGKFRILVNDGDDHPGSLTQRFRIESDGGVFIPGLKTGATQGAAGAAAGEIYVDTDDQTLKVGV